MRLKLVLISSLVAAIVGVGSTTAIVLLVFSSVRPTTAPGWLALSTYLIPMLAILLSSLFVYRHTARRRKLQAVLTAIIGLLLTCGILLLFSIITAPIIHGTPPQPDSQRNVG